MGQRVVVITGEWTHIFAALGAFGRWLFREPRIAPLSVTFLYDSEALANEVYDSVSAALHGAHARGKGPSRGTVLTRTAFPGEGV